VYTINDYFDGPRLGIADVDGVPHIYEAEFDHSSDEYGDTYFASPVDGNLMALVLEDWEIWLRWQSAFQGAKASIETHPALPQDHERHQALTTAIGGRLQADRERAKYLKARFESAPNGDLLVEWRPAIG
jgi:hypothetical protein